MQFKMYKNHCIKITVSNSLFKINGGLKSTGEMDSNQLVKINQSKSTESKNQWIKINRSKLTDQN